MAAWGEAQLIRYLDGKTELRGGSKEDRLAAQEWISLFWHEAVVGDGIRRFSIVVDNQAGRFKVEPRMAKTNPSGAGGSGLPKAKIRWAKEPEPQDYPAARSYLSLHYRGQTAKAYVKKLKRAPVSKFKAKDIFRASGLSLLGISNSHVETDRRKIKSAQPLSPLLLVRDAEHGKVIIADGYHRLCAVYGFDEDAVIPCKIV